VIYPSIDKLLNLIDSKYELVHVAASRSYDIKHNNNLQMPKEKYKSKKNIGRALEEIANGLVVIKKD
jgi:DNA-directed RNA polymerase subunit omega